MLGDGAFKDMAQQGVKGAVVPFLKGRQQLVQPPGFAELAELLLQGRAFFVAAPQDLPGAECQGLDLTELAHDPIKVHLEGHQHPALVGNIAGVGQLEAYQHLVVAQGFGDLRLLHAGLGDQGLHLGAVGLAAAG